MKKCLLSLLALAALAPYAHAQTTIADWTFENSAPTTGGPFAPESGAGAASAFHSGVSTYSAPAGNGSSHSFSSNTWSTNDYYQFTVSTLNLDDIKLTFDQTGSSTGPKDFKLEYSTDGTSFSTFENYSPLVNGSPNTPWTASTVNSAYTITADLSAITAVNNDSTLTFRLVDADTTAENGGTVGTSGTDRVDNVIVSGTAVVTAPEPSTYALGLIALVALASARFQRRLSSQV